MGPIALKVLIGNQNTSNHLVRRLLFSSTHPKRFSVWKQSSNTRIFEGLLLLSLFSECFKTSNNSTRSYVDLLPILCNNWACELGRAAVFLIKFLRISFRDSFFYAFTRVSEIYKSGKWVTWTIRLFQSKSLFKSAKFFNDYTRMKILTFRDCWLSIYSSLQVRCIFTSISTDGKWLTMN